MMTGDEWSDGDGHCPECGCDEEVIGPPGPRHAETCSKHWKNQPKDTSEDISHWSDEQIGEALRAGVNFGSYQEGYEAGFRNGYQAGRQSKA